MHLPHFSLNSLKFVYSTCLTCATFLLLLLPAADVMACGGAQIAAAGSFGPGSLNGIFLKYLLKSFINSFITGSIQHHQMQIFLEIYVCQMLAPIYVWVSVNPIFRPLSFSCCHYYDDLAFPTL